MHVLKLAAALYREPGNTWADVVRLLAEQGHRHSRLHLQMKCDRLGLLARPGFKLCSLCKTEFKREIRVSGIRHACDDCRAHRLPAVMSLVRRRGREVTACSR